MITSLTEFYQILRAIVIHHKPANLCNRLNSFAVIDKMTQLNTGNAEMTLNHYHEGLFWARDWHNKGKSPNELAKEYDILIVEAIKGAQKKNMTDRGYLASFYVVVVGQVERTEKQCSNTVEGKRAAVMNTLNEVLRELVSYEQYEIDPASGSNFTGWASEAQAEALIEEGIWNSAERTGERLDASIIQEGFSLYTPDWNSLNPFRGNTTGRTSLVDNVVAVATQIDIEICSTDNSISYKYDSPQIASLGVVKCPDC